MATQTSILSSLKAIINEDFSCAICLEPCTDTLINPECGHRFCGKCIKESIRTCNRECPTCRVHIPTHRSCRKNSHFDHILHRIVTELVSPLENFLNEKKASEENKRQLAEEMHSAVEVGGAETKEAEKTLDEVCAQNQVIAVNGSRKRDRSSQEHQFLGTATANNEEAMYKSGNGNDDAMVDRGRKALKTNEHDCSSRQVRRSRKRPTASYERIEAAINSSSKNIPKSHDPSEEQEKSSSTSSNQSVTARNDNNPSHSSFVAQQNTPSWNFESSGMSHTKNPEIIELLKETSPHFQKRIKELMAFKAKFGHCNVTRSKSASNKPYLSLGQWCIDARYNQRLMEEGKPTARKLSKAQIECLDAVGFQWKFNTAFDERIEELKAFKAKYGHCNVTKSTSAPNKPYLSLGKWCANVRNNKGKSTAPQLSKDQIERLDAVGFQWERKTTFEERIEELKAFKTKFGHCNVTVSTSASNKPYVSLGRWCSGVQSSRRLMEEGKPTELKLSKDQIERLDALGFRSSRRLMEEGKQGKHKLSSKNQIERLDALGFRLNAFDERIEELKAFKAKFGHCNVTASKSASNKLYFSLGRWCNNARYSRRLMEERKQGKNKLSKDQVERLDAVGFQWKRRKTTFDDRIEELKAFKAKYGHCNVTESASAPNKPYVSLGRWCFSVRRSRRLVEEGKPTRQKLSKDQIERLDAVGFQWKIKTTFDERIEELKAFKAKYGHSNVTKSISASNKPYVSLGDWCANVRRDRRLMEEGKPTARKLSKDQIECLDAVGFQWKRRKTTFGDRIEELKAFKTKFGDCNVTVSTSASNKPYVSLGHWCRQVRSSRRLMEEGKPAARKLSKDQIERLDAVGFLWNYGRCRSRVLHCLDVEHGGESADEVEYAPHKLQIICS